MFLADLEVSWLAARATRVARAGWPAGWQPCWLALRASTRARAGWPAGPSFASQQGRTSRRDVRLGPLTRHFKRHHADGVRAHFDGTRANRHVICHLFYI